MQKVPNKAKQNLITTVMRNEIEAHAYFKIYFSNKTNT
jgi:hypothetical protein